MINLHSEIRKRYGNIKRARGFYLYTEKNIRLLDLYLDGGMSILGRKSGQANLSVKQFLDRGLTGIIPSSIDTKLENAIGTLFPEHPIIRIYATVPNAYAAIQAVSHLESIAKIPVWQAFLPALLPLVPDTNQYPAHWCEAAAIKQSDCTAFYVMPVFPVPYGIVAAKKNIETVLPPSDPLYPPLAAGLARSFHDVKRIIQNNATCHALDTKNRPPQAARNMRRLAKQKMHIHRTISCFWHYKGNRLFPLCSSDTYKKIFFAALDARIVLSPNYYTPSFLPDNHDLTGLQAFLHNMTLSEL